MAARILRFPQAGRKFTDGVSEPAEVETSSEISVEEALSIALGDLTEDDKDALREELDG